MCEWGRRDLGHFFGPEEVEFTLLENFGCIDGYAIISQWENSGYQRPFQISKMKWLLVNTYSS